MRRDKKAGFRRELTAGREAFRAGDLDEAFRRSERAHVLGQRWLATHLSSHWWMLRVALRRRDRREVRGQLRRLIATFPGYAFGWVPKGNTGGVNVHPLRPMPVPTDLRNDLGRYSVTLDVIGRILLWAGIAGLIWLGFRGAEVLAWSGEREAVETVYAGTCEPVPGLHGAEDIVADHESGLAYAIGGDRRSFRGGGDGRARVSAVGLTTDDVRLDLLPPEPTLRSFGGDLHTAADGTRRLLIANRPDGQHAVEVYVVMEDGRLRHERSLTHPLLRNPNDLVALGADRALVTLDNEADAGGLAEVAEGLRRAATGRVLLLDGERSRVVADGLLTANGIALSGDGRTLYVAEMTGQALSVFDRDPATDRLASRRRVALPTSPDNLTIAPDGRVLIAGHAKLLTLALLHQRSGRFRSPTEIVAFDPESGEIVPVMTDDGSVASGGSVALAMGRGGMLVGTAFGPAVLRCSDDSGAA